MTITVRYSVDLETQLYNRNLREKQHKQRESHLVEDEEAQVFSDTELYGTRFCIDSDLEDDELPSLFASNKTVPIKRIINHGYSNKSIKNESRHISSLPPLIEHVSERERKIEIKSSKQSRIVPPRVRPKSSGIPSSSSQRLCEARKSKDKQIIQKSETHVKTVTQSPLSTRSNSKEIINRKPPKSVSSPKSCKLKTNESTKSSPGMKIHKQSVPRNEPAKPPPVPPRPKKKTDSFLNCIYEKDLASLDYVNDSQIRVSPDGCQDTKPNYRNLPPQFYTNIETNRKVRSDFSSPLDEYFMEEDVDEKISRQLNEFEDYFDQEFISELENYQLPKSSVNMLVLQHFK